MKDELVWDRTPLESQHNQFIYGTRLALGITYVYIQAAVGGSRTHQPGNIGVVFPLAGILTRKCRRYDIQTSGIFSPEFRLEFPLVPHRLLLKYYYSQNGIKYFSWHMIQ